MGSSGAKWKAVSNRQGQVQGDQPYRTRERFLQWHLFGNLITFLRDPGCPSV